MTSIKRANFVFTAEVFAEKFNLPSGTLVHQISYDPRRARFMAYFTSEGLPEVPEGQESYELYYSNGTWIIPDRSKNQRPILGEGFSYEESKND